MSFRSARLAVAAVLLVLSGCTVQLQHDLAEDDANDIYVLLQKNGIDARKDREEGGNEPRYVITVAKADIARAAELLRDYALPRPKADGLAIFKKSKGMIPTQTEERAMFIEALGGEVSNALNRVPGVLEARAIVMIPEVNDLTQPDKKPLPTASVFIKYRPVREGKVPVDVEAVRAFVATAVPEMRKENVTVLLTLASDPESEHNPENELKSVLGLRMTAASAGQFKSMVGITGLLVLVMAGLTAWNLVRGGGTRSRGRRVTNGTDG